MTTFRPAIVTIMGHVDHGKTSLLDKIRSSNVASREAGAITQHIGAYQAIFKNQLITFLDTPGHAAFVKMRERGASITDIVVLVISAGEGIMPQTKECIEIIKANNQLPIVALTKIDLPNIYLDKAKGQLVEADLTPEEYGGQVPVIPVSAKTGEGIDKLLETILLHAQVLELKNQPQDELSAVVIESSMDKQRGPVATVIVKTGTLKTGNMVYSCSSSGKVKGLFDYNNKLVKQALPGTPVEILGLTSAPDVGDTITTSPQEIKKTEAKPAYEVKEGDIRLPVILKADTQGTLEALKNSFSEEVRVISSSVGLVNDNDIYSAESAKAVIYSFNLKTPPVVKTLADNLRVSIFESKIIYEIIENIQQKVLKLMEPTIDEIVLGEATIQAEFKINKVRIAGIKITKGEIKKGDTIHLLREGKIIKDTRCGGIQMGKNPVETVKSGQECGMTFMPYVDFHISDTIMAYKR